MNKKLARLLPLLGVLMALGLLLWAGNQAGRGAEIEEQPAYAAESINKTLPKLARKDVMMEGAYAQGWRAPTHRGGRWSLCTARCRYRLMSFPRTMVR